MASVVEGDDSLFVHFLATTACNFVYHSASVSSIRHSCIAYGASALERVKMTEARASVLLQPEAERLVEELKVFDIAEVGTSAWTRQHQNLEKLNMQAQICVMNQSDEFVVEALIDHEKVTILIHDLLVTEAWKEKVLPLVQDDLAGAHYVKLYLIMYHEAIVLGLLEKAFFTSTAVAAGGDMLVELADYCYRRTVYLNNVDPNQVPHLPMPSPLTGFEHSSPGHFRCAQET